MGWMIALGVLVALALLPIGIYAQYNQTGALLQLIFGPLRKTVYPASKKKKSGSKQPAKSAASKKSTSTQKSGGVSWQDFMPLLLRVVEFLKVFRKRICVNQLTLKLILADDDPCDLAVNYGRANGIVESLVPYLESVFRIKRREIAAECDFTADKTIVIAQLNATMPLYKLCALVGVHGIRIFREYLKISKIRKGGAKL